MQGPAGPQGERGLTGPEGPPNPNAVNAQNADRLDSFDSLDFLKTNALAGGDLTGAFSSLQIAPSAVTAAEVAQNSLGGADIDESTLGQVPNALSAVNLSGRSMRTFNFHGVGPTSLQTLFVLGGLTLQAGCIGVSPGNEEVFVSASTNMNDSYIRSDIAGIPADPDWDVAEGDPAGGSGSGSEWFESDEDKAGIIVYRQGAPGSSARVVSVSLAWDTTGTECMLVGTAMGQD